MLALFRAGASFTPSPVTATNSPCLFRDSTIFNFWSGVTLEKTFFVFINNKKLTFNYYPELRKGNFLGKEVTKNDKDKTISYELQLPTDELFKKVHGPIVLHYTVYTEKNIILLTNIEKFSIFKL